MLKRYEWIYEKKWSLPTFKTVVKSCWWWGPSFATSVPFVTYPSMSSGVWTPHRTKMVLWIVTTFPFQWDLTRIVDDDRVGCCSYYKGIITPPKKKKRKKLPKELFSKSNWFKSRSDGWHFVFLTCELLGPKLTVSW